MTFNAPDADVLVRRARSALTKYLPGAPLTDELSRVRALLDAHMFGRDKRASRDDVVEVAREIDRLLPGREGSRVSIPANGALANRARKAMG